MTQYTIDVNDYSKTFKSYTNRVSELLSLVDSFEVSNLISSIRNTMSNGGTIYVLGNGGSATTASHFVNDLTIINKRKSLNIKAISLVDSMATITAISNDESYGEVFKIQLLNRLQKNDLVFSISASGNSANLINAVTYANELGVVTSSLLGFDGGILKTKSKNICLVSSDVGEYGPVEDAHLAICHYLSLNI
jgi:D-sedoheptulose 7-phosphate isomerase